MVVHTKTTSAVTFAHRLSGRKIEMSGINFIKQLIFKSLRLPDDGRLMQQFGRYEGEKN